jgi:hypothetical protein
MVQSYEKKLLLHFSDEKIWSLNSHLLTLAKKTGIKSGFLISKCHFTHIKWVKMKTINNTEHTNGRESN